MSQHGYKQIKLDHKCEESDNTTQDIRETKVFPDYLQLYWSLKSQGSFL